ncbi:MAG: HlyC/CorC family transporter [Leptospiraceae bacterium]|nr:HlyC/CorC family transporter [Leptospiraceae bacterium]
MSLLLLDIIIILALILLNGFFSSSEIAVISVKPGRLAALIEEGNHRAKILKKIKSDPDRFFATVQIGVTLVGVIASAYGGSQLMKHLEPWLGNMDVPYIGPWLNEIAFVVFVFTISYLTLILGELVPKSLALGNAEKIALLVAWPLSIFARFFHLFTLLLTVSSNLVLRPFRDSTSFSESHFQEEEIKHLLMEGVNAGTIDENEHKLIENVFEINDTEVREIMEPRPQIRAIDITDEASEIRREIIDLPFSRLPVYRESLDHIIGVLHTRDYMRELAMGKTPDIERLLRPAYPVPETMRVDRLLKELLTRKMHVAIVVDEYGVTAGILTMEDILDEIVGGFGGVEDNDDDMPVRVDSGQYRVSGMCTVDDFNFFFQSELGDDFGALPESEGYNSIAGFVISQLGRFPEVGEQLHYAIFRIQLVRRVRNQLVQFMVTIPESSGELEAPSIIAAAEHSGRAAAQIPKDQSSTSI